MKPHLLATRRIIALLAASQFPSWTYQPSFPSLFTCTRVILNPWKMTLNESIHMLQRPIFHFHDCGRKSKQYVPFLLTSTNSAMQLLSFAWWHFILLTAEHVKQYMDGPQFEFNGCMLETEDQCSVSGCYSCITYFSNWKIRRVCYARSLVVYYTYLYIATSPKV